MNNKNCANYTDFTEQFYHKKIVQAPGGESHFSIGWSNEKTDYGPPRNSRSLGKAREQNHEEGSYGRQQYGQQPTQQPTYAQNQQGNYGQQQQGSYPQGSYQPMYQQPPPYQPPPLISEAPQPVYQIKPPSSHEKYAYKQEGTYGPQANKVSSTNNLYSNQPEQIDLMTKEYDRRKKP